MSRGLWFMVAVGIIIIVGAWVGLLLELRGVR